MADLFGVNELTQFEWLFIDSCNIYFCFIDYTKAFYCVDQNKLWKILKETGKSDHLTCLLRNLYAGQQATVRTGHRTTDWLQIGKGLHGCILTPCLFKLYAKYIMQNMRLDEAQAGIEIAGRNINNLRYADNSTLRAKKPLVAQRGKASACSEGDLSSIPESGTSPGEGNGNTLQYSCLENPMDWRAW